MPATKLKQFLEDNHVPYEIINHFYSSTAQKTAATTHIPGKNIAKTVMVKVDGKMVMAVLPASYRIDMGLLRDVTGSHNVTLATEAEFRTMFPDCEVGAMPPFGNLYGLDVFVAYSLTEDEEIAFNACTHTELIRMSCIDYLNLVNPVVLNFSYH